MSHQLRYDPVEASRQRWIEQGWDESAPGMAAVVSVIVALATAWANPSGTLVPMLPLGLAGLWGARHGVFPARRR